VLNTRLSHAEWQEKRLFETTCYRSEAAGIREHAEFIARHEHVIREIDDKLNVLVESGRAKRGARSTRIVDL